MSLPSLTNSLIPQQQTQSLIINQIPHQMVTNVSSNNSIQQIPIVSSISHSATTLNTNEALQSGMASGESRSMTGNYVGIQTVPVQSGISTTKGLPNTVNPSSNTNSTEPLQVLTKARLNDLVRDVDPTEQLDEEVEDVLLTIADDFVEYILNGACTLAKHRHVNTVEVKDIQLHLNKNFDIWVPGFGTDELRPYKRPITTEAHKQRLALIRRAMKKY